MLLFSTEAVGSSLETRLQLSSSSILYVVDNDQGFVLIPDSHPKLVLGVMSLKDQRLVPPLPMGNVLRLETKMDMSQSPRNAKTASYQFTCSLQCLHGPPRSCASATCRQCRGLQYPAAQLADEGHDKQQFATAERKQRGDVYAFERAFHARDMSRCWLLFSSIAGSSQGQPASLEPFSSPQHPQPRPLNNRARDGRLGRNMQSPMQELEESPGRDLGRSAHSQIPLLLRVPSRSLGRLPQIIQTNTGICHTWDWRLSSPP